MSITDSIQTCFKKYATFEGRASRSEYWWFWLCVFILSFVPGLDIIVGLVTLIPIIAAGVRRLHDTNHSGWWLLFPIYNIVLLATEGDRMSNDYGERPMD